MECECVSSNPTPLNASFIALVSGDRIGKMFRWLECMRGVSWNPTPLNASFIALVSEDRTGKMLGWFGAWGVSPGIPPLSTPPS
jgi:hypothetical protein